MAPGNRAPAGLTRIAPLRQLSGSEANFIRSELFSGVVAFSVSNIVSAEGLDTNVGDLVLE